MYDVVIIGAGVIGTGVARELARYKLKILVLEKENDVACGATKANSAIVHGGYDAPFNTLKGKYNKLGNDIFEEICKELDVEFKRIGSYVVAFDDKEIKTLEKLKSNGEKLKIEGLKIISGDELRKTEKNISKNVIKALYSKSAGITDPWGLAIAYMENAVENGVELKLNYKVEKIEKEEDVFIVNENIKSKIIINASGVYSDNIYNMITTNNKDKFIITPRKGQYFVLDKSMKNLVNSIIFQCPNDMGKGVLIIPTVDGNILVGPDSENINNRGDVATNYKHLKFIKENISKVIDVPFNENIKNFAGLRAEPDSDDFIIGESEINGFFNIAGIKSPGLSSAPAIVKDVALMVKEKLNVENKKNYKNTRKNIPRFYKLSDKEKNELIKADFRYGNIVCRCENITEKEIVDAINSSVGATTVNGIKRRVRAGSGRCSGNFCQHKVVEILKRELKVEMEDISLESNKSKILIKKTKSGD